uniref:Uncharacterized protein n=1 Tax=Cacopsylla melanoneura TaxID=428564 RepID=A0A8D8VYF1_9HEMI
MLATHSSHTPLVNSAECRTDRVIVLYKYALKLMQTIVYCNTTKILCEVLLLGSTLFSLLKLNNPSLWRLLLRKRRETILYRTVSTQMKDVYTGAVYWLSIRR